MADPSENYFSCSNNDKQPEIKGSGADETVDSIEYLSRWSEDDEQLDVKHPGTDETIDPSEYSSGSSDDNEQPDVESSETSETVYFSNYFLGWPDDDEHSDQNLCQMSALQDLCLIAIIENFDRFYAAFKMHDSKVEKKNLEFLAIRFSERIFQDLKERSELRSEHLDFLISPHMKKLDIIGLDEQILPALIERLEEHGNNILTFQAESSNLCDDFRRPLMSTLRNVENIHYRSNWREWMNDLFYFSDSEENLQVQIPPICEAMGKFCSSLKHLTFELQDTINLEKYNYGIAFVINHCHCLENLQCIDTIGALYKLHKSDLSSLRNSKTTTFMTGAKYALKNLSSEYRTYPLCDALEICVVLCPYVCSLYVDCLKTDEELEMISHFINLEHLNFQEIMYTEISSGCLTKFLSLRGSKLLSLSMDCVAGLPAETLILSCQKLQTLRLRFVENLSFEDISEQYHHVSLSTLLTLELSFSDFTMPTPAACGQLIVSAAKNLKSLSFFDSVGLTNEFVNSLNLFSICILDVSQSDVTVHPLIQLLNQGSLQELNLQYCGELSDDDYLELERCASDTVTIKW